MTDSHLIEVFLSGITTFGPSVLGLALLLGTLGMPLPATLFMLAAGAFVRQGLLDWGSAAGLGLLGVVLGDSAGFALGRFAKDWGQRTVGHLMAWQKAQASFERWGGLAIYVTRFLFTPLSTPVNLAAGGSDYPFWRFLIFNVAGSLTRIFLVGGLGYLFGSQWELVNDFISRYMVLMGLALVLAAGVYFVMRRYRFTTRMA